MYVPCGENEITEHYHMVLDLFGIEMMEIKRNKELMLQ